MLDHLEEVRGGQARLRPARGARHRYSVVLPIPISAGSTSNGSATTSSVPAPAPEHHEKASKAGPSGAETAVKFLKSREGQRVVRGVFGILKKAL